MGMPSGMEIFVILAIVLLLFGGKKIPELAKGLGSGIKNFKKAIKDDEETTTTVTTVESTKIEDTKKETQTADKKEEKKA